MATPTTASKISYRKATETDIPSLTTILFRAFHPKYDYVKEALPDTPAMHEWFRTVYTTSLQAPNYHPLVAISTSSNEVIGLCALRLINAEGPYGDMWTLFPWTPDHSETKWKPVVECLEHYEKKLMRGKAYYQLELLAVDFEWQGEGIGKELLQMANQVADESGHEIFVQSGVARHFYVKAAGFEILEEPMWGEYQSAFLVRRPKGKGNGEA